MAVNGNICIYRLTSSGGSNDQETDVTDKVEFDTSATNGASTVPDAKSHVDTYSSTMTLVTQENPVPDSNNPSGLQDTGLATVLFELTGYFDNSGGNAGAVAYFRNWQREDKTNSAYPFGRFGIRNDERYEYNTRPTATNGLILEHFEITDEYEFTGKTGFIVRLRYNGDISRLGVS
jgi:hypothetical protein